MGPFGSAGGGGRISEESASSYPKSVTERVGRNICESNNSLGKRPVSAIFIFLSYSSARRGQLVPSSQRLKFTSNIFILNFGVKDTSFLYLQWLSNGMNIFIKAEKNCSCNQKKIGEKMHSDMAFSLYAAVFKKTLRPWKNIAKSEKIVIYDPKKGKNLQVVKMRSIVSIWCKSFVDKSKRWQNRSLKMGLLAGKITNLQLLLVFNKNFSGRHLNFH